MGGIKNRIFAVLFGVSVFFNVCYGAFAASKVSDVTTKVGRVVCERKFGIPVGFPSGEKYVIVADFLANYMKRYIESYGIKKPDDGGHYEVLRRNPFRKYEIMHDYDGCGGWCIMFYIPLSKEDSYGDDVDYMDYDDSDKNNNFSNSFDDDFDDDFDFDNFSADSKRKKDEAKLSRNRRKLASDLGVFYNYNINCEDFRKELKGDSAKDEFKRYINESRKVVAKRGKFIKSVVSKIDKVFRRSSGYGAVSSKEKSFYELMDYLNKNDWVYDGGYDKDGSNHGDYLHSFVEFLCNKKDKKLVENFNKLRRFVDRGGFDEKKCKGYYNILLNYYKNKLAAYGTISEYIKKYIDNISKSYGLVMSCFEYLSFSTDVKVITTEIKNVVKEQRRVDIR